MRNIKLLAFVFIAALSTSIRAQKTYTFDDGVALATDWTVADNTASVGGTAKCEIAAPGKFTAKNGNYLLFSFENKSNISITVTSTASYNNISDITFDVVANDNSKPNFTLNIVDDNGNVVKNVYSNKTTKTDFNTGGTNKWGVSSSAISPAVSGHVQLILLASSSGKYAAIDNLAVTYQAGPPPASNDATLSSIVYGSEQTPVPGFSANQFNYDVELPADYVGGAPSVQATTTDANATTNITQATTLPGTATIVVTAEDGTTTKTYTVTFSKASAAPKVLTATWTNIKEGTAAIDQVNKTITGEVINGSSRTAITPTFTGNNIDHWTPTAAQDFSNGAVNYVFYSSSNETTEYTVTITEEQLIPVSSVSLNKSSLSLQVGGSETLTATVFPANAANKNISWSSDKANIASVANGVVTAKAAGTAVITVTTEDGGKTATCTVTVTAGPPVPSTTLTTHVPDIYEAKDIAGGYNGTLRVVSGREYEVYYPGKTNDSYASVCVNPNTQKMEGMTTNSSATYTKAKDGWFEANIASISNYTLSEAEEFEAGTNVMHKMANNNAYKFHIRGYDQFSIIAKDKKIDTSSDHSKPANDQLFDVYVDDVVQPRQSNASAATIRRYNITTGEHVIEVRAINSGNSELYGFSLRVAQEPRTKYLKGNDSTQTVLQTQYIKSVVYTTKYNNIPGAETRLVWLGNEASGIVLQKTPGELTDTLMLSGQANCPVGVYNYAVAAYYNDVETSRATGSFKVGSDIQPTTNIVVDVYQNEEMDQIKFKYYALEASAVQLTWPNGQPAGISGSGNNGVYIIGGTPTAAEGVYSYQITVLGADTIIKGSIRVRKLDYGTNPVLYLYKNDLAYEKDGVYTYLTGKQWNMISRKAKEDGLRPSDQYAKYKWILISEDADANNPEVLGLVKGGTSLPVLNMNAFSYAFERNEDTPNGWGEPDNGSISDGGCYITVQRGDHPIFKTLNKKKGDRIQILDSVTFRGLMPINIQLQSTLCLATSPTRNIDDYEADGDMQTIIHEIPAGMRGNAKYICFPISKHSSNRLTQDGKKTLDAILSYLLSSEPTVLVPTVQITGFTLEGIDCQVEINQVNNTINVQIDRNKYPDVNLTEAKPIVTLADAQTTVTPASGETVDLSTSAILPVKYVVTDFINRRVYNVSVTFYSPEGIDEVYTVGEWVNVYDIFGRKITTTNENVYSMELPRGVYIIVNENGNTFKITR